MFRITPVGTCRIHTPLSRGSRRAPIELDLRRNYGFVHTSVEALQLVRFLQGEKEFQPEVLPLVFRPGDEKVVLQEEWQPADLHVVEISSAKKIMCGADAVQINYLYRHFADFFGSPERSRRFWNLNRTGHREDLLQFLRQQRSYELMSEADRHLLSNLSTEQQTFKAIKTDMAEIMERLGGDRVVFVTHVNAVGPEGEVLPTRDRLVRWVRVAGEQLGAEVFDPTPSMLEFGQERAMESGGRDLTHYTAAFSDAVYDEFHRLHVLQRLGSEQASGAAGGGDQALGRQIARLEVMLETGDFFAAAKEVHQLLEQHPQSAELRQLRGIVRARIGDDRGAIEDLGAVEARFASQQSRLALLSVLTRLGDSARAVAIAEDLIRDEVQDPEVFRLAATAAEGGGSTDQAVEFAKQAYRLERDDLATALRALRLLSGQNHRQAEAAEFRQEMLENLRPGSSGAFELCLWAIEHRDEELVEASLRATASGDKWSAIDLVEDVLAANLPRGIAAGVGVVEALGRLQPALAERRRAFLLAAYAKAVELSEQGEVAEAHRIAQELTHAARSAEGDADIRRLVGDARRLARELKGELRSRLAAAHDAGDFGKVLAIGRGAGDFLREDGRSTVIVARALQSAGDAAGALRLLKQVSPEELDTFIVRRWTARLAASAQEYATAIEAYGALRDQTSPEALRLRPEIDRFFGSVEGRSHKQLRALALAGDFDEGLRLARNIKSYVGLNQRGERELDRLHKLLRARLRQVEDGELPPEEREAVFRRMVEVRPTDQVTWKRLAVDLMRQGRHAEAAECWAQIVKLDPHNRAAEQNRARCITLAARRASSTAQVIEAVG